MLKVASGSHARTWRAPQLAFGRHLEAPGDPQRHTAGRRMGFIQELRGALLRRFVAARQSDYASHAGPLWYGAAVAPRCTSRIENMVLLIPQILSWWPETGTEC